MQQQHQELEETRPDIQEIVARLDKTDLKEKALARSALEAMGPQAVEELLAILAQEAKKRNRRRVRILAGYFAFVSLIVLISILTHSAGAIGSIGSMSGILAVAYAASREQKRATKALALFDDLRAVGPLAEALEFQDRDMRRLAEEKLTRLLPQLKASDAHLLTKEQRACLARALNGRNTEFSLVVLKALEQVGDGQALPIVEKLAHGEGRAKKEKRLQMEAEEVLPFLRQRAAEIDAHEQLLRAADGNATPSDVLLRPATGTTPTDPEQLLRPDIVNHPLRQ